MRALTVNCTLKTSPAESNTEALAGVVIEELERLGVETDQVRAVDHAILPGVTSDEGEGDGWPAVLERVMNSEVSGALIDIGYTIPGQAWTYWNRGPGPGDDYLASEAGRDWSHETGRTAARNLVTAARALTGAWNG